jgi:hypothetical protein
MEYDIYATDPDCDKPVRCFLWIGRPEDGVARAQHEAQMLGLVLCEFRAVPRLSVGG